MIENSVSMTSPSHPIVLYRTCLSGHCHRVQLFLSILRLPYELVDVDLRSGAHKAPEFVAMSLFSQVPVIDDAGTIVYDSNAILAYLATLYDGGGRWLPRAPLEAAKVQAWLSVAAGQVANGPAAARLVTVFGAKFDVDDLIRRSNELLQVMNKELTNWAFLTGTQPTIADIANYTYIAHAPEGNVDISKYPGVTAWLERIEALPGFVPMQRTATGLFSGTA